MVFRSHEMMFLLCALMFVSGVLLTAMMWSSMPTMSRTPAELNTQIWRSSEPAIPGQSFDETPPLITGHIPAIDHSWFDYCKEHPDSIYRKLFISAPGKDDVKVDLSKVEAFKVLDLDIIDSPNGTLILLADVPGVSRVDIEICQIMAGTTQLCITASRADQFPDGVSYISKERTVQSSEKITSLPDFNVHPTKKYPDPILHDGGSIHRSLTVSGLEDRSDVCLCKQEHKFQDVPLLTSVLMYDIVANVLVS